MSSNFLNLFNQVSNMVMNNFRSNAGKGPNLPMLNAAQANLLGGNSILPQVNLSNNQALLQPDFLENQQFQETIFKAQEALKEFTQEDKSILVKTMLNLPEDMSKLLENMVNDKNKLTNAEFMKLLSTMSSHGREAMSKLSKLLIVFGANNLKGTEHLQEIYTIVNACTSGNVQNAAQLMKNMILLYLPWLPLGESNNFDLSLKENSDETSGGGEGASDSIVILIQTVNFSNVSVTLSQSKEDANINMFVECAANFPKEELQSIIDSESKTKSVSTDVSFAENKNSSEGKNEKLTYNMNVTKFLNPYLMVMAQAVVKAVIEIDKHSTLIEKRRNA